MKTNNRFGTQRLEVGGEDSEHGRYGPSACRDIGASTGKTGRLRLTQRRGAGLT